MTEEIWKDVVGYEGYYQVSDFGNVRSLDRVVVYPDGKNHFIRGIDMALIDMNRHYKRVVLRKDGKYKYFQVHRLVAMAFIQNPEDKPCVNHIDGNPANNNLTNLEWCTYSENERHSFDVLGKKIIGTMTGRFGYDHNKSKEVAMLDLDMNIIRKFGSMNEASRHTGINVSQICICCKKTHRTAMGYYFRYV